MENIVLVNDRKVICLDKFSIEMVDTFASLLSKFGTDDGTINLILIGMRSYDLRNIEEETIMAIGKATERVGQLLQTAKVDQFNIASPTVSDDENDATFEVHESDIPHSKIIPSVLPLGVPRRSYSPDELCKLEQWFSVNPNPSRTDCKNYATILGRTQNGMIHWFRRKRSSVQDKTI